MPKNTKRMKNAKNVNVTATREFNTKDEGQDYALILRPLGNKRMQCKLPDGSEKLGIIRGNLKKKKNYVNVNNVVLVSLREFQDNKVDIIGLYNESEVKTLRKMKEIPSSFVVQTTDEDLASNALLNFDVDLEDDDDSAF